MFPLSWHAYESPCYGRMPRWAPGLRFDRARRKPEREPRIDPLRIALQHRVVELARGRRRLGDAVDIADGLPGLFNDRGAVVVPRLENYTGAEAMVAVAVRRVDRRQILAARHDPIHHQGACRLCG